MRTLVLSCDTLGMEVIPTVIRSVERHTEGALRVVVYSRGMHAEGFRRGRLEVEFRRPREEFGQAKGRIAAEMFDRLWCIADLQDTERVMILDWDQLAVGCLEELWDVEMTGQFGAFVRSPFGKTFKSSRWIGEGYWAQDMPGVEQPFFRFGGMLNLEECRKAGILQTVQGLAGNGSTEQALLAHAMGGNYAGLDRKWNNLVKYEGLVPDARILHWHGGKKPWSHDGLDHAELWHAARCSWREIRLT